MRHVYFRMVNGSLQPDELESLCRYVRLTVKELNAQLLAARLDQSFKDDNTMELPHGNNTEIR